MLEKSSEGYTKGDFIWFYTEIKPEGRVTNIYTVRSNDGTKLGEVRWFSRWRKYCFFPSPETVYEEICLGDISEFNEGTDPGAQGNR